MRGHLRLPVHPEADPANVVAGSNYRITVLDPGLIRLEYSDTGEFEDRPSQMVVNRAFAPADFTVVQSPGRVEIDTERFHLVYDEKPFSPQGLSVRAKAGFHREPATWRPGAVVPNLGGTARTMDDVDGATALEDGVLSRHGIAVIDDSRTVLLGEDGWIAARHPGHVDLYVFSYGLDYKAALGALYRLAGRQPLLPRFALGNWWSRFHRYTAAEYVALIDRFRAEGVPLSVAVIDMDWHLVDIDPAYGTGWTGYTWNAELFPDPPSFLEELHERGLMTSLNVHPAEGIHAHEKAYAAIATRLGIDPASRHPVGFDPTDPAFVEAYLEELHHPLEGDGVDFWWLDWQQGVVTKIPGLDPLWLLNHFHYLDAGRRTPRPITFSRYAGIGSHRYPIGFSGDTHITWESLDFQPRFTATASNAGYGWWSHDIGGHFKGSKDDELMVRWLQLGVFSPILRLHSSDSRFNSKEPWRFNEVAERVMKEQLRLRHQLVPYIYTMNLRAFEDAQPLVQPMYYDHPDLQAAYEVPNQFMFGTDLLVAPITSPVDAATGLGRVKAWLPEGEWIDIFTGWVYSGGRSTHLHRTIDSIPVLARAGAIVPMTPLSLTAGGVGNPGRLELRVYAGASGEFVLAEDNDDSRWARTRFSYDDAVGELTIHPTEGAGDVVPPDRGFDVLLCGFADLTSVQVTHDGQLVDAPFGPSAEGSSILVTVPARAAGVVTRLRLVGDRSLASRDVRAAVFALLDRAHLPYQCKDDIQRLVDAGQDGSRILDSLSGLDLSPELISAISEQLFGRCGRSKA